MCLSSLIVFAALDLLSTLIDCMSYYLTIVLCCACSCTAGSICGWFIEVNYSTGGDRIQDTERISHKGTVLIRITSALLIYGVVMCIHADIVLHIHTYISGIHNI